MKSINLKEVDKFYLALTVVLIILSVIIIFSFRSVFSLFLTAYELDPNTLPQSVRVNKENLNKAIDLVFNKDKVISTTVSAR